MSKLASVLVAVVAFLAQTSPLRAAPPPPAIAQQGGVWVLDLYGTREEMAAAHGVFVRDKLEKTALPFFAHKIHNAIAQAYIAQDYPALTGSFEAAIDWYVMSPIRERIPSEDRTVLEAFSLASGFPLKDTLNATIVPDAGQWLTAQVFHGNSILAGVFNPSPGLGCSTFVAQAEGSEGLLHARNLDYESYGIFDREPALIRFHPSTGQDYASVTSLGIHTAGITAINASGIALSLHQTMVNQVTRKNMPILAVTERTIREARTLDEAVAMLRSARYDGSWKLVLSSAREKRAVTLEVSSAGVAVLPEVKIAGGARLIETNHVHSELMRQDEFSVSFRYFEDTHRREAELKRLLTPLDSIDEQQAVDFISSPTVAKLNNIQSVVFAPAKDLVYISIPEPEGAKPAEGRYVPIRLGLFAAPAPIGVDVPPLRASDPVLPAVANAHALLRVASRVATEDGDFDHAIDLLTRAHEESPAEISYPLLLALSTLRRAPELPSAVGEADMDTALDWLDQADQLQPAPYHRSLIHLIRGRALDVLGRRGEALAQYRLVDLSLSKLIRESVAAQTKTPYHLSEARKMVIDFIHADVFRF